MSYLANALFILAVIGLSAGFVAWPLAVWMNVRGALRDRFRRVFWLHMVGVAAVMALAKFAQRARWPDAYLFILPLYPVGLATIVALAVRTPRGLRERR